jgi:hypothetical protein
MENCGRKSNAIEEKSVVMNDRRSQRRSGKAKRSPQPIVPNKP